MKIRHFLRKKLGLFENNALHRLYETPTQKIGGLPPKTHALVLAPHPDDESIGCGGTLKLLTSQSQGSFDVIFLTDGGAGGRPGEKITEIKRKELVELRKEEAKEACKILGASEIFFLNGIDGQLHQSTDFSTIIQNHIKKASYSHLFCPWPYEHHHDHQTTFKVLREAIRSLPSGSLPESIWLYEVWTPLPANRIVDISKTLEDKIEAISAHRSQDEISQYSLKFKSLAHYRSILCPHAQYAEAFIEGDVSFILSL